MLRVVFLDASPPGSILFDDSCIHTEMYRAVSVLCLAPGHANRSGHIVNINGQKWRFGTLPCDVDLIWSCLSPPCSVQLLDTKAVGVRREKMYKLDDHISCAVAGITGERPFPISLEAHLGHRPLFCKRLSPVHTLKCQYTVQRANNLHTNLVSV